MQIQAPYTGSGLITIERDRVYAWHWFHTTTTSSTQKIKLPAGIEGNAYVHVAFIRDPGSDEIYTQPALLRRAAVLHQSRRAQERDPSRGPQPRQAGRHTRDRLLHPAAGPHRRVRHR